MNLTREEWPLGWTPSESTQGDPRGLLRSDNLNQDQDGALVLCRAQQKINSTPFSNFVDNIYTKFINNTKARWVSLGWEGTSVLRSKNGTFTDTVPVITAGGNRACFGSALGQIFVCAGDQRKKDDTVNIYNLGLLDIGFAPQPTANQQPTIFCDGVDGLGTYSLWTLNEGTDFSNSTGALSAVGSATTFTIDYQVIYPAPFDLQNSFRGGPAEDPSSDRFSIIVQPSQPDLLEKIRIEFFLQPSGDYTDYYYVEFQNYGGGFGEGQFRPGVSAQSVLNCYRRDFSRQGSNAALNWSNVIGLRIISSCKGQITVTISDARWFGGALGVLTGAYTYAQVNVRNNNFYTAKSAPSAYFDFPAIVFNGSIVIDANPPIDPQVNEIWLYRKSVAVNEFPDLVPALETGYLVGKILLSATGFSTFEEAYASDPGWLVFEDTVPDTELLLLNEKINEFAQSVQTIPEDILGIEGLYYERMLYLTAKYIYLSERLNPDAVDTRYTIKAFGDPAEKNLWLKIVTNGTILLATTKDLYEITGTLLDLPDGTVDMQVRAVGEKYPSISQDVCAVDGNVFYMAADGWRVSSGSNSVSISQQLALLMRGEVRYGFQPVAIYANNAAKYPCAVARNRLYTSMPLVDGSRYTFVYDLIKKSWRVQVTDPVSFFAEEDDTILAGYGGASGNYLRNFDTGTTIDNDGTTGQAINLLTVFDDNGQPRNRKDTFTLKITADTGNVPVNILLGKDDGSISQIGTFTGNGVTETLYSLASYTLGFRYSLQIIGANLTTFKLFNFTIEYDPRPEQLNYMRIPPSNLGSVARKRFVNYAFIIDTLGNNVTFTPYIDNTAQSTSTVSTPVKQTYIHYFNSDTVGTDISGILSGGTFEFYQINPEEIVSEKLPTPVKFLLIPQSDYGSPNRKRHSSYKFAIHTRGADVRFTPKIDGVTYTPATFNTTEKRTVEYFFSVDTIGIDIGGTLESLANTPFEFYGVITPQNIEVFPPRLKEYRIPENNYGIPSKKRVRVIPMEINTNSSPVTFTPIVDGVSLTSSTITTATRTTAYHYFVTDVFGTDISGELVGAQPFEFYGLMKPETVEVLPVAKKYDQIGPLRYDKIAKLYEMRLRLIANDTYIPIKIWAEDDATDPSYPSVEPLWEGGITTEIGLDKVYTYRFPKNINGTIFRIVLGDSLRQPFYRFKTELRVGLSGMETSNKWVEV